jgi:predicted Zn-dependent protease
MTRRPSVGEMLLAVVVVALVAFVASQVVASPRRLGANSARLLSGRDSVSIAAQYQSQVDARRGGYAMPAWLPDVHIARLQAAAARDVGGEDSVPALSPDSVRALLAAAEQGTYLSAMLAEDQHVVMRWHASTEPIRVWVQPRSTERGFTPDLISPTRRAFSAWNEVALGVVFEMVDDSTMADVHVTWRAEMPTPKQIGTTFRMTGGSGWIAFAHVILSTSYDIYTVQNAARHEAGHVLGLGHSPDVRDIMAAETEGRQVQITDADRLTAEWLYRLPPGKVR